MCVVFSRYSLVKCFVYDLSNFLAIVLVAVFQSLLYYDTIGFERAVPYFDMAVKKYFNQFSYITQRKQ